MRVRTFRGGWATTKGCHVVVSRNYIALYDVSLACVGATQGNLGILVAQNLDGGQALELARQIAYEDVCERKTFNPFSESEIKSWGGFVMTDEDVLEEMTQFAEEQQ